MMVAMTKDSISHLIPKVQGVSGVADLLHFRARSHGAKDAVVCEERRLSYAQLAACARGISLQLIRKGVGKGDRVGIFVPNGIEYVAAFFGALGIGAVVVAINPLHSPQEIAEILQNAEASCLIAHETLLDSALQSLQHASVLNTLLVAAIPREGLKKWPSASVDLEELSMDGAQERDSWPAPVTPQSDLAAIVYTSDAAGKPLGVMLTHLNLLSVYPFGLQNFDIDERDRCLAAVPLCHTFGMTVVMIGTVSRGGSIIIMPKFDAKSALETIERERVTILPAVPEMYLQAFSESTRPGSYDLNSLRLGFSTGAPLCEELSERIEHACGMPVIEGYAITEVACMAAINPLHGVRKLSSGGRAVPGVQIAIFDDKGATLPRGADHVGEIAIAGANLMLGYWKQPEATARVFADGWFLTGDLGYLDEDDYLYVVGRKEEVFVHDGRNIYPHEIEEVIALMPGVKECAVIANPNRPEQLKAIVVRNADHITEEVVQVYCAAYMSEYKVPQVVEFVDALPRTSTGKLLKRLLK